MQTNHPVEALVIALGLIFPGPILFVLLLKFRAQRIYVTEAMSLFHGQPALVHLLILRCLRAANHFCGDFRWKEHSGFGLGDDHIARQNGRAAHPDQNVPIDADLRRNLVVALISITQQRLDSGSNLLSLLFVAPVIRIAERHFAMFCQHQHFNRSPDSAI